MKKHNWRNLILLVLLLISLIPVYYVISYNNQKDQEAENETESKRILSMEMSDVASVQFTLDGEEVTFTKTENAWKLEGDDSFEVEASVVENTISAITDMTANREITDVENLAEYGLEQPVQKVVLKDSDGITHNIYFGSSNDSTGDDYVYIGDDKTKVYTVAASVAQTFTGTLEDYRVTEEDAEDSESTEAADAETSEGEESTEASEESTENEQETEASEE